MNKYIDVIILQKIKSVLIIISSIYSNEGIYILKKIYLKKNYYYDRKLISLTSSDFDREILKDVRKNLKKFAQKLLLIFSFFVYLRVVKKKF